MSIIFSVNFNSVCGNDVILNKYIYKKYSAKKERRDVWSVKAESSNFSSTLWKGRIIDTPDCCTFRI